MSTARILVIDDEPGIRSTFSLALRSYGVAVAACGAEVPALLADNPEAEVVLCDVSLGDTRGEAVYELIAEQRPDLAERFVLMSGLFRSTEQAFCEKHGLATFVKPGSIVSLRSLVASLLT